MKVYETLLVKKDFYREYQIVMHTTSQVEFYFRVCQKVSFKGHMKLQRFFGFTAMYPEYVTDLLCFPSGKVKSLHASFQDEIVAILYSLDILENIYTEMSITD